MRIRLTLDIERTRRTDDEPVQEMRETQLDAWTERADPHPYADRPIGFRRHKEGQ